MFNCNSINLLTFTYYLKVILGLCMTIVPLFFIEKIVISFIKNKEKGFKINKMFLKKQLKTIYYLISIFLLAFSLYNVINKDGNKCFMYATKDVLNDYKVAYNEVTKNSLDEKTKNNYLESVLLTSYDKNIENNKNVTIPSIETVLNKKTKTEETVKVEKLNNKCEVITNEEKIYYIRNNSIINKTAIAIILIDLFSIIHISFLFIICYLC